MTILLSLAFASALAAGPSATPPQAERGTASQPTAAYYFLLGRYYEGAGKISDAVDALKKAIALEPKDAEPRAELAAIYARQENAPEAAAAAEEALKVDPKNVEANRVLGSVLAAYALAEHKQTLKPTDDVASYAKRATAALEIARSGGSGDLSIDLALARLYVMQDRPADAVPLLRHILDEQPGYSEGWLLLASAQEASGHGDAAVETLTAASEEQPQFYGAVAQLAELYQRRHEWVKAAAAWKRALALQPDDLRISFMLTEAQRQSGDLDAAEATARALRSAHPEDARATYLLAQVLESRQQHQEVVDLLRPEIAKLRTVPSKAGQASLLLGSQGLALQQLHKYDEALSAFKDAVALSPEDPMRRVLLIQGYSAAGRTKEAIAAAEEARQKFPEDSGVLYQLGAAFDRGGRESDAEKVFRDIIGHDPLDSAALNYLGYMLAEHGRSLDEAVSLIQRALRVEPDNPSYLDSLGWAYVQQGKIDLADQPLTTAAGKQPKNSVIQEHLGDLRMKQNRRADAIAAWQRALAGDGDSIDRGKIQKKIETAKKK
jgi:tetratricopeptide (TPR) repeat protein